MRTIFPGFLLLLLLAGCGNENVEVTVNEEGQPSRKLKITVENGDHVIIEDPFIEDIDALQNQMKTKRDHFLQHRKSMSPEQRSDYAQFMRDGGKKLLEMKNQRNAYIRQKMQEVNGTAVVSIDSFNNAIEQTQDYFKDLQNSSSKSSDK